MRRGNAVDAAARRRRDAAHDDAKPGADLPVEEPVLALAGPGREGLAARKARDRVGLDPGGVTHESSLHCEKSMTGDGNAMSAQMVGEP